MKTTGPKYCFSERISLRKFLFTILLIKTFSDLDNFNKINFNKSNFNKRIKN